MPHPTPAAYALLPDVSISSSPFFFPSHNAKPVLLRYTIAIMAFKQI